MGAGWHDPEYEAFGYPTDHRVDRFEEALQIIVPLLRGERVTYAGRYHETRDAILAPAPDRHMPILVAARGPRMLRLTARHADAWNTAWYGAPDERLDDQLAAMDEALAAEGRDPATFTKTAGMLVYDPEVPEPHQDDDDVWFGGTVDEMAGAIDAHDSVRIGHLIVLLQPMTEASLDRLAAALALRSATA